MNRPIIFATAFLIFVSLLFGSCSAGEKGSKTTDSDETIFESAIATDTQGVSVTVEENESSSEEIEESGTYTNGYITDGKSLVRINLMNILQEEIGMPNGCEAVSLAIALSYYGYEIDPVELFEKYMKSGEYGEANPFYAYVGDPRDDTGYGCYAPCAVRCVNAYLEEIGSELRAYDVSGSTIEEICEYLWDGIPVVIWGTLDMKTSPVTARWNFGGNIINWYAKSHCVVARGVNKDNMFICDPMGGRGTYPMEDVEMAYNQIYSQAVVIK